MPSKSKGKRVKKPKLSPARKLFAKAYSTPGGEGFNNATKAAKIAGYSEHSAHTTGHDLTKIPEVQSEMLAILDKHGVTEEKLAKRLRESLDAKDQKVFMGKDGNIAYSEPLVAHDSRLKSLDMAYKLRGRFPTNRTIEKIEQLRIQQNIIIVPQGGKPKELEDGIVDAEIVEAREVDE